MRYFTLVVLFAWLAGCGGAEKPIEIAETPKTEDDSEAAVSIIRSSFKAMGGLERLRLIGAKATIHATVSTKEMSFPVEITLGGPDRWKLDYMEAGVSYVYAKGSCRKVVYGVPARCTPQEDIWMDPTRMLVGLLFPAGDAANLGASFRLRGEKTIEGQVCDIVEVKPRNTNLRLRIAYSRQSKLPAEASFSLTSGTNEKKTKWKMGIGDWREINKVKVPHNRTLMRDGTVIWNEVAHVINLDMPNDNAFQNPIPPTTDQPISASLPARRVVLAQIEGQSVEIPAPHATVGGGPDLKGEVKIMPHVEESMQMVMKGKVKDAFELKESLKVGAISGGRIASAEAGVILMENVSNPDEPVLMMLYVPLAPKEAAEETSKETATKTPKKAEKKAGKKAPKKQ